MDELHWCAVAANAAVKDAVINQDDRKFYPNEFQRWRCRLAADCYPDWLPFYKVRGRCRLVIEMRFNFRRRTDFC